MKTEELVRLLETKELVLFGVGFVAEMFYAALERRGLSSRLRFAVVTYAQAGLQFHGRPVLSLKEAAFSEDVLLCAAVHESAMRELSSSSKARGLMRLVLWYRSLSLSKG